MQASALGLLLLTSSVLLRVHGRSSRSIRERDQIPFPRFGPPIVPLTRQSGSIRAQATRAGRVITAFCRMEPSSDLDADLPSVRGYVLFSQTYPDGRLTAHFKLRGFPLSDSGALRAVHVHQYRVVRGNCSTAGPHYNPRNVNHPQHPGDFDNFQVRCGRIVASKTNLRANLFGPESIIGRGLVLHEKEDDLGLGGDQTSLQTGNSGRRLACGTITLSNGDR